MANICEERIVIVSENEDDMVKLLEWMAQNVLEGPCKESYFSAQELEQASGNMTALYELIRRTAGDMNLLCLFMTEPDTRAESGWLAWRIAEEHGHYVFECEIGLKWGQSFAIDSVMDELTQRGYACSVSNGGEAYEWESLDIDGECLEAGEVFEAVEKAQRLKSSSKNMQTIARRYNLAGVSADLYNMAANDWEDL
jgi:hypothetical protein